MSRKNAGPLSQLPLTLPAKIPNPEERSHRVQGEKRPHFVEEGRIGGRGKVRKGTGALHG